MATQIWLGTADEQVRGLLQSVNGGLGFDASAVIDGKLLIGVTSGAKFRLGTIADVSPLTTNGDIWIYNSTNTRLGIGSTGQVLMVVSGLPAWTTLQPSGTLIDGATISWNLATAMVATVTLGGNRTLANPTNKVVGTYILHAIQDGTGSRTLAYGTDYKWSGGVAPTLSTAASAHDIITFVCDGTNMYGTCLKAFS